MACQSSAHPGKLSPYASDLEGEAKERYLAKLRMIGNFDPMLGAPASAKRVVPAVDSSDLVSYLVLETSFITGKQFEAKKGLEAYNQFVNGWVKDVKSFEMSGKHVSVARVSLSLSSALCFLFNGGVNLKKVFSALPCTGVFSVNCCCKFSWRAPH